MATATLRPFFPFPSDHLEQLSKAASVLTVNPSRNSLFYLFPFVGAYFNGYQTLRVTPSQDAMMPEASTRKILNEIEELRLCAGIREITPYIALNYEFACCGGAFSLTPPALLMPEHYLFRRAGRSPFAEERPDENLRQQPWVFSDDETRFFIARELGQISENTDLLRIAIKVCLIAALFVIFATPFGWTAGLSLLAGTFCLYIALERILQARADQIGVEILARKYNDRRRAKQSAIDALEKLRQQNLHRREHTGLGRFYITPSGANTLDFLHPYLSTRIERLESMS